MRSRADTWPAIALVLVMVGIGAPLVQAQSSASQAAAPDAAAVAHALEVVKADPNLPAERTIKTLRWKDAKQSTTKTSPWLLWIRGLLQWLAQTTRAIVWVVVLSLVAGLTIFLVRVIQAYGAAVTGEVFVAPTHVRSLDIRPETLPPDVGAAARALWDNGEHRAALALLYRGLLSRLVHVHRVPIRASSTEGDCLTLAARHLAPARHPYVTHLVDVWQRAVYGHHDADSAIVYRLCDSFGAVLDSADTGDVVGESGAA